MRASVKAKTKGKKESSDSGKKGKAPAYLKAGPIDIVKHRLIYIIISALFIIPGIFFIGLSIQENGSPIRLGIDFTGGTILEYAFDKKIVQDDLPKIRAILDEKGYSGSVIQLQKARAVEEKTTSSDTTIDSITAGKAVSAAAPASDATEKTVTTETETNESKNSALAVEEAVATTAETELANMSKVSMRTKQLQGQDHKLIEEALKTEFGTMTLLQKNSVGPTLAGELLTNGLLALLLAYLLIVGYLTFRFQFDYAVCAMLALIHDTLFVFGVFAALGYFFQVEVDSLFVTAILTVVGFSVHDTIVVFDRLRENARVLYSKKLPFAEIANLSVNQTLARSINTSLTTLIPLLALYFLGGETTREFILAIILGVIVGTYSSICVASMLLTWWRYRDGETVATARA